MTDPPDFSVEVVSHPGARVVAPHGEIDIAPEGQVRSACAAAGRLLRRFDIAGLNHRVRFVDDAAEALGDGRPPA